MLQPKMIENLQTHRCDKDELKKADKKHRRFVKGSSISLNQTRCCCHDTCYLCINECTHGYCRASIFHSYYKRVYICLNSIYKFEYNQLKQYSFSTFHTERLKKITWYRPYTQTDSYDCRNISTFSSFSDFI